MASLYIVLAALFVQGAHTYLLYFQRHDRKWSISQHAVDSSMSKIIYRIGHLGGGLFWLMAMNLMFNQPSNRFVFYIAFVTVVFEWLQALVLNNAHRVISVHAFFAYVMWLGCIATAGFATYVVDSNSWQHWIAVALTLSIIAMFLYLNVRRETLWHLQYASIWLFFITLFVLSL